MRIVEREKMNLQEFRFALKKAFDILGTVYAPIFFCAACLAGGALPVAAWKAGDVANALLGARGVGVLTSELTQGMWMIVVALGVFLGGRMLLARLEGKLHEVFTRLALVAEIIALLLVSAHVLVVFIVHALLLGIWTIVNNNHARGILAVVWFLGLVWMFFGLATDVALRVDTLGSMVSILAVCTLFYYAVTRAFFHKP